MIDLLTLQFLKGPSFLAFYALLALLYQVMAQQASSRLALFTTGQSSPKSLSTYHLALLQGDRQRALLSALVRLESAGLIKIDSAANPPTVVRTDDVRVEDPLESSVLASLEQPRSLGQLAQTHSVEAQIRSLEEELYAQDLLIPQSEVSAHISRLNRFFRPLAALGVARMLVGMTRARPVGGLIVLLVVNFLISLATCRPGRRNQRGERVLRDHLSQCAALQSTAGSSAKGNLSSEDLSLAMALFGTSALATALMPAPSSSSGCGSSSSCGSSCGGGCGGGCGGCGG